MVANLTLRVLKFSYAIGVRQDNSVPWAHVIAPDMFVKVEGSDTQMSNAQLTLKMIKDTEILESIHVSAYIDHAITIRRTSEQSGITLQVDQLPIFGITKDNLLAIRYQLQDGQAKRLQFRLESTAECRSIVNVFEQRGMQFQDYRPRTSGSTQAASSTQNLGSTPSPAQLAPAHIAVSYGKLPLATPTRNAFEGAPSWEQPTNSNRPFRSSTSPIESPVPARANDNINHGSTTEADKPSANLSATIGRSHPNANERPATVQGLYHDHHQPAPHAENSPDSISASYLTGLAATPGPGMSLSSSSVRSIPRQAPSVCSSDFDTLEHEIPPRRDLPFARPGSRAKGKDSSSSRPSSSSVSLPPLPQPNWVDPPGASSGNNAVVQSSHERPSTASSTGARPHTPAVVNVQHQKVSSDRIDTQTGIPSSSPRVQSATLSNNQPCRMNELLYGKRPLAERSPNANAVGVNLAANDPLEGPSSSPERQFRQTPLSNALRPETEYDFVNRPYSAIQSTSRLAREDALNEYAAQSAEDRSAALDEFMIDNLENPHFAQLCEDVEKCWRRIALGL